MTEHVPLHVTRVTLNKLSRDYRVTHLNGVCSLTNTHEASRPSSFTASFRPVYQPLRTAPYHWAIKLPSGPPLTPPPSTPQWSPLPPPPQPLPPPTPTPSPPTKSPSMIAKSASGAWTPRLGTPPPLPTSPHTQTYLQPGRMRNSKILLIGIGALANETAKNLVLAGIGSLTLLDNSVVTAGDLCSQFFIQEEHVGMNVSTHPTPSTMNSIANAHGREQKPQRPPSNNSTPASPY